MDSKIKTKMENNPTKQENKRVERKKKRNKNEVGTGR